MDLSVVEIGGHIEREVSQIDYDSQELLYCGIIFTFLIAAFPFLFRFYYSEELRHCFADMLIEGKLSDWNVTSKSLAVLLGSNWQVSLCFLKKLCTQCRLSQPAAMYVQSVYFFLMIKSQLGLTC